MYPVIGGSVRATCHVCGAPNVQCSVRGDTVVLIEHYDVRNPIGQPRCAGSRKPAQDPKQNEERS